MHTLVIVGCGKTKADSKRQAKDLYTGQLFKAARRYAEAVGTNWLIASAKFGLVDPESEIEPYDYTLNGKGREAKSRFRNCCQADFAGYVQEFGFPDRVIILAGKEYVGPLVGEHGTGLRTCEVIELPLKGMGIGQRLAFFKNNLEAVPAPAASSPNFSQKGLWE